MKHNLKHPSCKRSTYDNRKKQHTNNSIWVLTNKTNKEALEIKQFHTNFLKRKSNIKQNLKHTQKKKLQKRRKTSNYKTKQQSHQPHRFEITQNFAKKLHCAFITKHAD